MATEILLAQNKPRGQPVHLKGKVLETAQKYVGENCSRHQNLDEILYGCVDELLSP